jgi:hypothetical protein
MVESATDRYLSALNPAMRKLADEIQVILLSEGCSAYVKTIYIGYDLDGEMVAALYAHPTRLEVALALPEDAEGACLIDASHLTWRTLPVAAEIVEASQLAEFGLLAHEACLRIKSRSHDVMRENEFFIKSRRERTKPPNTN